MMRQSHPRARRPLFAFLLSGLLALPCALALPAGAAQADLPNTNDSAESVAAAPTTVIVVRHAEKAGRPEGDPDLSMLGYARAGRLTRLLERSGVTAIYASQFRRTQQTVAQLADSVGLDVQVVDAKDIPGLVKAVHEQPGGLVVVAAHSNTVGPIIEALGGAAITPLKEDEYDKLFVVSVPAEGPAGVLRLTF